MIFFHKNTKFMKFLQNIGFFNFQKNLNNFYCCKLDLLTLIRLEKECHGHKRNQKENKKNKKNKIIKTHNQFFQISHNQGRDNKMALIPTISAKTNLNMSKKHISPI